MISKFLSSKKYKKTIIRNKKFFYEDEKNFRKDLIKISQKIKVGELEKYKIKEKRTEKYLN